MQSPDKQLKRSNCKFKDLNHPYTLDTLFPTTPIFWVDILTLAIARTTSADNTRSTETAAPISGSKTFAVLDTGIDLGHQISKYSRGRIRQFWDALTDSSDPKNCVDKSGHGTHIVSIILRTATNADVYVARISESRDLDSQLYGPMIAAVSQCWHVRVKLAFQLRHSTKHE